MKDGKISQFLILLVMVVTGNLSLSDEQIETITQVIMSGTSRSVGSSVSNNPAGETIRGMTELAQILGVSVPTACKISRSGKFDDARLNFGTKKHVWDRAKLLEIARNK